MIAKDKKIVSVISKIRIGIALIGMLCVAYPIYGQAAQINFEQRIAELKAKFPDGKYWNHVGMNQDNSDSYTNSPCSLHKAEGVSHVYGTGGCTCNHFTDGYHLLATQCMGFANKLGYDVFGGTNWTVYNSPNATQIAQIVKGDIVRIDGYHSVFVISRNGNKITVGEANYPNGCQINWDREIDLTNVTISYYEHANNYNTVIGNAESSTGQDSTETPSTENNNPGTGTTEQPAPQPDDSGSGTTEQPATEVGEDGSPYTGWKQTADGVHYQYFKGGELQKNTWLTLNKKKYYLDENGYRVTGFYDVKKQTYYFNNKGVIQKKKWFQLDGETYYVNEKGLVLKSQWLWYSGGYVYVTKDGSVAKNELVKIGSQTYLFNAKGKRSKGFKKCNGKYYYCNNKGIIQKKKWITKSGKKYYLQKSGVRAQSKLLKIGKYQYYFNSKGQMVKNKRVTYKGKMYKADKKGRCKFIKNVVEEESVTE